MSIKSMVKALVVRDQGEPAPETALNVWRRHIAEQIGPVADAVESLARRIQQGESQTLQPFNLAKQELAGLKDKRRRLLANAYIEDTKADVASLDRGIASTEARVVNLAEQVEVVNVALAHLGNQLQDKQRHLEQLKQEGFRLLLAAIDERLANQAQSYAAAIEALKTELIEVSAIALARDAISPRVQGSNGVGARGLASLEVPVPNHSAYEHIGGFSNLNPAAEARKREILADLGVRA